MRRQGAIADPVGGFALQENRNRPLRQVRCHGAGLVKARQARSDEPALHPAQKLHCGGLVDAAGIKAAVTRRTAGLNAFGVEMPVSDQIGEPGVEPAFTLNRPAFNDVKVAAVVPSKTLFAPSGNTSILEVTGPPVPVKNVEKSVGAVYEIGL